MSFNVDDVLRQMTLEEKVRMIGGKNFWTMCGVERLGVPALVISDGPCGVRKPVNPDIGLGPSVKATCYPSAVALAATWDRGLVREVGEHIAADAVAVGQAAVLGPGNNMKRSPLCGRNFEYYSEDPVQGGELCASFVDGIQSRGVAACMKHFAVNNQETLRFSISAVVDERTLREIYLPGFEIPVKKAHPMQLMCCYNRVNGQFGASHHQLLTEILRDEWGFDGFVMSDWGAVNNRATALSAGMDLEMPGTYGATDAVLLNLAAANKLDLAALDRSCRRLLEYIHKVAPVMPATPGEVDSAKGHAMARRAAEEAVVLLKNEGGVLPLSTGAKIAVVGDFAVKPRYEGGGSSHVSSTIVDIPLDEIKARGAHVSYARGYDHTKTETDAALVSEAVALAKANDVVVVFAALTDTESTEGADRKHLRLGDCQNAVIEAVAAANRNVVVVLTNPSAVVMPWLDRVRGVIEGTLLGQGVGSAIAKVLFGEVNPSGKLAETYPLRLEDTPAYLSFPGDSEDVIYREGIYIGYRHYDTKKIGTLFPFGFGLSYTTFEVSGAKVALSAYKENEIVEASVSVKNTGAVAGAEVVQLYVRDVESSIDRPDKELKGFEKVFLAPGESKTVTFQLDRRAFAFYDVHVKDWRVEEGEFELLFATSAEHIHCSAKVTVSPLQVPKPYFTSDTPCGVVEKCPETAKYVPIFIQAVDDPSLEPSMAEMQRLQLRSMPLRLKVVWGGGSTSFKELDAIIAEMNRAVGHKE